MIDPHVHCRDGKQSYKETIAHAFEIAEKQGVRKIFDMPNTEPPIETVEQATEYKKEILAAVPAEAAPGPSPERGVHLLFGPFRPDVSSLQFPKA